MTRPRMGVGLGRIGQPWRRSRLSVPLPPLILWQPLGIAPLLSHSFFMLLELISIKPFELVHREQLQLLALTMPCDYR